MSREELFLRDNNPLKRADYPLSSKYHPKWVSENCMGPSALWLTEFLLKKMSVESGQKVLDLGCGSAMSSIFLALEFSAQVWATDLWIKPTENWKRIQQAELENSVFPIYAEAHSLPYAENFFDAITAIDSYCYFGTDDLYLSWHLLKFIKKGGTIGIVVPGFIKEFDNGVPLHFKSLGEPSLASFHSPDWWSHHFDKTGLVDILVADSIPNGHDFWRDWVSFLSEFAPPGSAGDQAFLDADKNKELTFVRIVMQKK